MTRSERLKKAKRAPSYTPVRIQRLQQQILNLQHIQLQNITPFKQISARLAGRIVGTTKSKIAPTQSNPSNSPATHPPTTHPPATDKTAVSLPFIKESPGSRLAFHLLLVRPWVLVVGFWLISMLSASLAWEGMISPRKLTMALPQPNTSVTSRANKNAFLKVELDADEGIVRNAAPSSEQRTLAAGTARSDDASFPKWPIGALVGTCAAGCLGISRRRTMVRLASMRLQGRQKAHVGANVRRPLKKVAIRKTIKTPSRQTGKPQKGRPVTGQPVRGKFAASQLSSTLTSFGSAPSKKRRPRKRAAAMRPKPAVASNRVLTSRATAKPTAQQDPAAARNPNPRPVRPSTRGGASRRQGVVSVVPASTSHALDWANGSLAHQLDVRPRHTASM